MWKVSLQSLTLKKWSRKKLFKVNHNSCNNPSSSWSPLFDKRKGKVSWPHPSLFLHPHFLPLFSLVNNTVSFPSFTRPFLHSPSILSLRCCPPSVSLLQLRYNRWFLMSGENAEQRSQSRPVVQFPSLIHYSHAIYISAFILKWYSIFTSAPMLHLFRPCLWHGGNLSVGSNTV